MKNVHSRRRSSPTGRFDHGYLFLRRNGCTAALMSAILPFPLFLLCGGSKSGRGKKSSGQGVCRRGGATTPAGLGPAGTSRTSWGRPSPPRRWTFFPGRFPFRSVSKPFSEKKGESNRAVEETPALGKKKVQGRGALSSVLPVFPALVLLSHAFLREGKQVFKSHNAFREWTGRNFAPNELAFLATPLSLPSRYRAFESRWPGRGGIRGPRCENQGDRHRSGRGRPYCFSFPPAAAHGRKLAQQWSAIGLRGEFFTREAKRTRGFLFVEPSAGTRSEINTHSGAELSKNSGPGRARGMVADV